MKILLCAATEMEIAPTIRFLSTHQTNDVVVVVTGVGLMTCTYALTKSVFQHQPDLIMQGGIAGTLNSNLELGSVVAVRNETIGDLGVQEGMNFQSLFELNLLSRDMDPWQQGLLTNENEILHKTGLPVVDCVTVNEISTNEETIAYYREKLNAQIETMEGAALHYVGLMEKIPFIQIRSLSNFIGERDKEKWMMEKAIANLNHELLRILKDLQ